MNYIQFFPVQMTWGELQRTTPHHFRLHIDRIQHCVGGCGTTILSGDKCLVKDIRGIISFKKRAMRSRFGVHQIPYAQIICIPCWKAGNNRMLKAKDIWHRVVIK